jgi:hypothetical protein
MEYNQNHYRAIEEKYQSYKKQLKAKGVSRYKATATYIALLLDSGKIDKAQEIITEYNLY